MELGRGVTGGHGSGRQHRLQTPGERHRARGRHSCVHPAGRDKQHVPGLQIDPNPRRVCFAVTAIRAMQEHDGGERALPPALFLVWPGPTEGRYSRRSNTPPPNTTGTPTPYRRAHRGKRRSSAARASSAPWPADKTATYRVAVGVKTAGIRWQAVTTATQQLAVLTHPVVGLHRTGTDERGGGRGRGGCGRRGGGARQRDVARLRDAVCRRRILMGF
jgi:hypothetical protein